jgi:hypothetical protein
MGITSLSSAGVEVWDLPRADQRLAEEIGLNKKICTV